MIMTDDTFRIGVFVVVFVIVALAEAIWPRRALLQTRTQRWVHNLMLGAIDVAVVKLFVPLSLTVFAAFVMVQGWGLFNMFGMPLWAQICVMLVVLDLAIYGQHVLFHKVPFLWRLHRVHHTDTDLDVTTALRFHPLEILVSLTFKACVIAVLGAPPAAILLFEMILNACAMFNHGNMKLPPVLDGILRTVLVTPDMHRIHHSTQPVETNSNYGFSVPFWDKIFGTYRPNPQRDHADMDIGLEVLRSPQDSHILALLRQPFRGKSG